MNGGQTIVIFFLCSINDYRILRASPVYGIQNQVPTSFNQKEWVALQKQRRERAEQSWERAEKQKVFNLYGLGAQESAERTKPRARTKKRKQALRMKYEPIPPKGVIDKNMSELFAWLQGDKTPGLEPDYMKGDFGKTSTQTTADPRYTRSPPPPTMNLPMNFTHNCDYIAYYCLKVWDTGHFCARSVMHQYANFTNYCELQYVNCMERYELWYAIHPGYCLHITEVWEHKHYPYHDDYFLDQHYRQDHDQNFDVLPMHYHDKTEVQWHP